MPGIKNSNSDLKEKICNTIYGAATGDALGVPVEFRLRETIKHNPVTDMAHTICRKAHGQTIPA